MTESASDREAHVNDLEIAAYIDRGLSPTQMERIEDHLSRCPPCRENVVRTQELVATARRPRRIFQSGVLIAAAAAVAIIAVPSLRSKWPSDSPPPMRGSDAVSGIVTYGPAGETSARPVRFIWARIDHALSYRLTVTTPEGSPVVSTSTSDTSVVLPDSTTLKVGSKYVWIVDAIVDDGTSRSSGLHGFGLIR